MIDIAIFLKIAITLKLHIIFTNNQVRWYAQQLHICILYIKFPDQFLIGWW